MIPARVVLQPRRARPFYGRHPWVYPGAISAVEGAPADGDIVDLHAHEGPFVARGLYNSRSKIRVRLYSWSPDIPLDLEFFRQRLQAALHLRGPILRLNEPGKACRLVFSEADGLSGCTVDRYDRWLVLQFTSLGMAQRRDLFVELLVDLVQPEGIYLRTERGIGQQEGLELQDGPLWGKLPSDPIVIEEHGLRFHVNLTEGQKTGFYLDQRDNRAAVARFAAGRRVLDAFCYTGGFALHAARAGAREVEGVDVSEPALALAEANARLNGLEHVRFTRSEVFDRLVSLIGAGERYGLVILDPPKFARSRNAVDEAMRGYRRLHAQGLRLLEPDGILATCCCSGLINRDMLQASLAEMAAEERREVQLLEMRGQAADHPVAVSCPETDYLKCLICRVQ
jgi:23S rRNA (cytosine1962-C5)-methyltransferase